MMMMMPADKTLITVRLLQLLFFFCSKLFLINLVNVIVVVTVVVVVFVVIVVVRGKKGRPRVANRLYVSVTQILKMKKRKIR